MNMKMKLLAVPPSRIENKPKTKLDLQAYFDINSIEGLIIALERGQSKGYFTFHITLSPEYFAQQRDKYYVLSGRTDTFTPVEPLGMATYGLKKKSKKPLSRVEVREIITENSNEMTERYLLFTLGNIDSKKLHKIVKPISKSADMDEAYERVEYKGLVAEGARITYFNNPINMSFQHRQALRLLIEKQGDICTKDDFYDESAEIFTRDIYDNIDHTLRNLIYEVRSELKTVIGRNCIKNASKDGWQLDI